MFTAARGGWGRVCNQSARSTAATSASSECSCFASSSSSCPFKSSSSREERLNACIASFESGDYRPAETGMDEVAMKGEAGSGGGDDSSAEPCTPQTIYPTPATPSVFSATHDCLQRDTRARAATGAQKRSTRRAGTCTGRSGAKRGRRAIPAATGTTEPLNATTGPRGCSCAPVRAAERPPWRGRRRRDNDCSLASANAF